jgi:hypothetical protein
VRAPPAAAPPTRTERTRATRRCRARFGWSAARGTRRVRGLLGEAREPLELDSLKNRFEIDSNRVKTRSYTEARELSRAKLELLVTAPDFFMSHAILASPQLFSLLRPRAPVHQGTRDVYAGLCSKYGKERSTASCQWTCGFFSL